MQSLDHGKHRLVNQCFKFFYNKFDDNYRTNNHILKHYVRSVVITTQFRQDSDFRMHTFHPFSHSIVVTCTFLRFLSTGAWIQEDDIVNFRISCITYIFSYVSLYNVHSLQAYNSLNGVNYFVN